MFHTEYSARTDGKYVFFAAVRSQTASCKKFARCLRSCFRLCESLNANNSVLMKTQKQDEVRNLPS